MPEVTGVSSRAKSLARLGPLLVPALMATTLPASLPLGQWPSIKGGQEPCPEGPTSTMFISSQTY